MANLFKKNIVLIITFILLFAIAACNDKTPNIIPVNADMAKHFNYKQGSYWIYRDTISGRTDSFAVENNDNYITGMDIFVLDYSFSNTGMDTFSFVYKLFKNTFYIAFAKNGSYFQTSSTFSYPLNVTFTSYNINGTNYSNIEQDIYSNDLILINDSVGIVKMVIDQPSVSIFYAWELIRCKIIL